MPTAPDDNDLGKHLYSKGWKQGTVCSAPSLYFLSNQLPKQTGGGGIRRRSVGQDERLVIASQDCDIVVHQDIEPYVEALICTPDESAARLQSYDANSARYFVIDPGAGLVAHAKYKLSITKVLLDACTPEPWPSDQTRFRRFVRWLARRYDRPPVPDELDAAFRRPIEEALKRLRRGQRGIIDDFTAAIREVRYSIPRSEDPPYTLSVVMLAVGESITNKQLSAIQQIREVISNAVDASRVRIRDFAVTTDAEISLAEYQDTWPLFLEYYTFQGSEVVGAEPAHPS